MSIIIFGTMPNAWHSLRTFVDCQFRRGFINQFFNNRQPGAMVTCNAAKLLAFPAGKFLEAILPTRQFTTLGYTWSLNPGKFSIKEHTVITIMANIGFPVQEVDYVRYNPSDAVRYVTRRPQIFWIQYLPSYFNQAYASSFGYQSA